MCLLFSKAIALFEDDERYKAVDRSSDREDLFESYLVDLQKKVSLTQRSLAVALYIIMLIPHCNSGESKSSRRATAIQIRIQAISGNLWLD